LEKNIILYIINLNNKETLQASITFRIEIHPLKKFNRQARNAAFAAPINNEHI
jgi:hypothetical protein